MEAEKQDLQDLALIVAVKNKHYDLCDLLLDGGADVNVKDKSGDSPLHIALKETLSGDSPEKIAFRERNMRFVEKLLAKGADIEAKGEHGWSPLLVTVVYDNYDAFDLLFDRGADVNTQSDGGDRPLHIILQMRVFRDSPEGTRERLISITKKLLDKGADKDAVDEDGNSPLVLAVRYYAYEAVDLLLDRDANVNTQDSRGNSPLHIAIANHGLITNIEIRMIIIKQLLDKGADMEAKNEDGDSPLSLAVRNNYEPCYLLLDRGADINVKNNMGQTPLHCVKFNDQGLSYDGVDCIIRLLLLWGGSMLVMDNNGETPLDKIKMNSPDHYLTILKQLKWLVIELKPKELKTQLDIELKRELEKIWGSPEMSQHFPKSIDDDYLPVCLKELEKMKTTMFGCHSLHDYYISYKRDDPPCVTNYELDQAIMGVELYYEFPIYATLIKITLSKAKRRRPLLDAAEQLVKLPLPNEIIRQVLACLSNEDLKIIIESNE